MSVYYQDEYEDYESYNLCECGAMFDADGWCPYCDFMPGQYSDEQWGEYHFTSWLLNSETGDVTDSEVPAGDDGSVTHEYWDHFDTMDLDEQENAE